MVKPDVHTFHFNSIKLRGVNIWLRLTIKIFLCFVKFSIFASCHDDVAQYLQPEYIVRAIPTSHAKCWKTGPMERPEMKSTFRSDNNPQGRDPNLFMGAYTFPDDNITLLGASRIKCDRMDYIHSSDDKRHRFRLLDPKKEARADPIILYANAGKPNELRCDENTVPGDKDVALLMENNKFYVEVDGKRTPLDNEVLPIMSANKLRKIDKPASTSSGLSYDTLDLDIMHTAGWYVPEGYTKGSKFRGLEIDKVKEMRPPYRSKHTLEAIPEKGAYLAVFVPVSKGLAQASEVMRQVIEVVG